MHCYPCARGQGSEGWSSAPGKEICRGRSTKLRRRESGANAPYLPLLLPLQFSAGIPTGHIQSDGRRQSESLDAVPTGQPSEPRAGLVGYTAQKWRCVDVCSLALWPHCRLPASWCLSATGTVSVRGERWELSVLCCSAPWRRNTRVGPNTTLPPGR